LLRYARLYAYQIANWTVFLSVAAEVAATLTGLIFVAVSINLNRILEFPGLSERAAESIMQLLGALLCSVIALVPGQSVLLLGVQLIVAGVVLWVAQTRLQIRATSRERRRPIISFVLSQLAILPFCFAGLSLTLGAFGGLYWLSLGLITALTVGISNAWVLLVEILR
jgi:hypothetical protein